MSASPDYAPSPREQALTPLEQEEQAFCDSWYAYTTETLPSWLQPGSIDERTQRQFALKTREIVATTIQPKLVSHEGKKLLPGTAVMESLVNYYKRFPSALTDNTHRVQRIAYQNDRLQIARQQIEKYPEVNVGFALRRAFRERDMHEETRAMFALLTAYGDTIRQHPLPTRKLDIEE